MKNINERLTLKNIKSVFEKNMSFFKDNSPELYQKFFNFIPNNLKISENNNIIIFFYNNNIIDIDSMLSDENIENKFHKILFYPSKYDCQNTIFHKYINTIYNISPIKSIAPANIKYYFDNHIPLMIVIGIGTGHQIEYLIKNFNIKHFIILEPDPELFYLSMHLTDWSKIILFLKENGGSLNVHFRLNINSILNNIKFINPVFVVYTVIYEYFDKKNIRNALEETLFLLTAGLGFYDDEKLALKHSLENIRNKIPVYNPKPPLIPPCQGGNSERCQALPLLPEERAGVRREDIKNAAAFIIAAGPSLDDSIEIIKKYKDRAVLFSAGTALKTLEQEGIRPDFHIEAERSPETYETLNVINREFLKEVSFIGNNTVSPEFYASFGEKFMFLKSNYVDTGSKFFPQNLVRISYSNPTVTNAALAIALKLGFENIYLFGTDMGFKNPKYHHSKHNVSMDKNSNFFYDKSVKEREIEGNFGQTVYIDKILLVAKNTIEHLLSLYPYAKVYNCSDGAKIKNTIPLKLNDLNIPNWDDKEKIIKFIKTQFTLDYLTNIDIKKSINKFWHKFIYIIDNITKILDKKVNNKFELIDIFYNMYQYVIDDITLRGSIIHFQYIIYSHAFAEKNEKAAVEFINDAFPIFKEFLNEIKEDINEILFGN